MAREKAGRRRSDVMPEIRIRPETGYARISIGGKRHSLGKSPDGKITKDMQREAARLWLQHLNGTPEPAGPVDDPNKGPTVAQLCLAYLEYADRKFKYRDGRYSDRTHSSRFSNIKRVCSLLDPWFDMPTAEFEPNNLEEFMASMIDGTKKRSTINKYKKDCLTMFAWGVPKKLVPGSVVDDLKYVRSLEAGETEAVESEGVEAIADEIVDLTMKHAHPVIATMIKFQRLTGARPQETCILKGSRIDMSDDIWVFFPEYWKTMKGAKKKDRRAIIIDYELQQIIQPYLDSRPADKYCFSPKDAYPQQAHRVGEHYLEPSYRGAIQRAAVRAGLEKWAPNQLRHTRSTEIKLQGGSVEQESAELGHSIQVASQYDHSRIEMVKQAARARRAS